MTAEISGAPPNKAAFRLFNGFGGGIVPRWYDAEATA
jgi:hypothetical protein